MPEPTAAKTLAMLQRIPVILAVTARSYGLQLPGLPGPAALAPLPSPSPAGSAGCR